YFGDGDGFERVYRMIERACAALLEALLAQTKAESGR
ncbi:MAG: low molecular weight phosphotyrosine protein phosphatase, partial [Planctomycetota bacterium]